MVLASRLIDAQLIVQWIKYQIGIHSYPISTISNSTETTATSKKQNKIKRLIVQISSFRVSYVVFYEWIVSSFKQQITMLMMIMDDNFCVWRFFLPLLCLMLYNIIFQHHIIYAVLACLCVRVYVCTLHDDKTDFSVLCVLTPCVTSMQNGIIWVRQSVYWIRS